MTALILGMQCVFARGVATDPARLAKLAGLVADPRWSIRFKLVAATPIPGDPPQDAPHFPGQVPAARLRAVALAALSAGSVENVLFSVSRQEAADRANLFLPTGRRTTYGVEDIFSANAKLRLPSDEDPDAIAAAWVELQHEIVETLGALHGVIMTTANPYVDRVERWLSNVSVDGKPMHPDPEEISSYGAQLFKLGSQYIRKPRWGTYLKPAHVAAIGGRAQLLEVVQPPVVRDVGDLLYLQLSERVSDAESEVVRKRWMAFAALVAPIVMPPWIRHPHAA